MSASLVGSEMCIRDSSAHSVTPNSPDEALQGGVRSGVRPPTTGYWLPVSYTHLTLPTICSV
eukprot:11290610-Alexandrium_andersonii.AAC.1